MSKSLGNVTAPQDVIKQSGADILRLWVAASDYADDLRIGTEILKTFVETYRKLRNTLRWMLGALAPFQRGRPRRRAGDDAGARALGAAPPGRARRARSREAYAAYDYKRVVALSRSSERRSLGLLLRRPQGRALLRPAVEPAPPSALHGARRALPPPADLARADPRLHHGGGLARALPGERGRLGAPRDFPDDAGELARPGARRALGARSAASAASSPARSRSSARRSASAPASRRRRWSTSPIAELLRGAGGRRSRRDLHHLGPHGWRRRRRRRTPSASTTSPASPSCRRRRRRREMRPLLEVFRSRDRRPRLSRRHAARRQGACASWPRRAGR